MLEHLRRRKLPLAVALSLVVGGLGGVAWAQTCSAPAIWDSGLSVFCPGQPAVAVDMNNNFSRLVDILQKKVGPTTANEITATGQATVNGPLVVNGATLVNGLLDAQAVNLRSYLYPSPQPTTGSTSWALSGTMVDSELVQTFSTTVAGTVVAIDYSVSGQFTNNGSFLVTYATLDGNALPETKAMSNGTYYPSNKGHTVVSLGAGSHTVRVRYRCPEAMNITFGSDWQARSLSVLVFGR
jgi:hypothetical protein